MTITTLPARDPIFALAPELKLHLSERDGKLVVNSREVSRVFGRRHRRVIRQILEEVWHAPTRPVATSLFRQCADGTIDMTSDGLVMVVCGPRWGKRGQQFLHDWIDWFCAEMKAYRARTGRDPLTEKMQELFGTMRVFQRDESGALHQCCDDCRAPEPAGPVLHNEIWATIAQPDAFLCFDCTEKRLGRPLTQADLTVCPFNAGWISFDGADVIAMQFAWGRRLLPVGPPA